MLTGKTVVLAVSGSIAAYKIPNLARMLKKQGCDVQVLMTQNATQFINPITFESNSYVSYKKILSLLKDNNASF